MNEHILEIIGQLGKAAFSAIEIRCDLDRDDLRDRLRKMRKDGLIGWTGHSYVLTDAGETAVESRKGYAPLEPEMAAEESPKEIEPLEPEIAASGKEVGFGSETNFSANAELDPPCGGKTAADMDIGPVEDVEVNVNYYPAAIDIITDDETDFRDLCIKIAKENPKLLCEVFSQYGKDPKEDPWKAEVRRVLDSAGLVPAIKKLRELRGLPLKEAKDIIDDMRYGDAT